MRLIPDRLGPKLGLFLVGMFALLGLATAALIIFGFARTRDDATESSREGLEQEAQRTLLRFTTSQADFAQAQLEATAGLAEQASRYMLDARERQVVDPAAAGALQTTSQGVRFDARPDRRSDVLIPQGTEATTEALTDVSTSAVLDDLFPSLLEEGSASATTNFEPISMYFQSVNNVARIYPRVPDIEDVAPRSDDLREATFAVGPEANPQRRTIWSPPYEDAGGRGLVMSATVPVYEGDAFLGAMGVDFSLERLVAQVEGIKPTANGFAFYIDDGGALLPTVAQPSLERELADARNGDLTVILDSIRAGKAEVGRAEIDGREMFVAHVPLERVGGTLALAAPVDEVTFQAAAVEDTIESGSRNTLLLALGGLAAVFLLTLAIAAWLNRRLVLQPIAEIVDGTRSLAAGDLSQRIPVRSHDELGTLADSFNTMTAVLNDRTNNLREQEEQYRAVFEASSDGFIITRVGDGAIIDVNPAMCAMHGYTKDELSALHPTEFIHADDHHLFVDFIATTAAGGDYRCRARDIRKDGSLFPVEVMGTPISYRGERHVLGLVRDITAQVEAERILEERVEDRTSELAALLQVSQSVAAALDIKSVAHAILSELASVSDYVGATLAVVEEDELVIIDSWGPFREEIVDGPTSRFPRSFIPADFWEVMERGAAVIVGDVQDDTPLARSYRKVFRPFLELPSFAYIRAWIAVPLVRQGNVVGMLTASHDEAHHFSEENTSLIMAAASQASVAMENARLFEQTQARTDELQILLDVAQQLSSTLELDPLLGMVLDQVKKVADYDRVSVLLADEEQTLHVHMTLRKSDDITGGAPPGARFPKTDGPLFWATFDRGEAVVIGDVRADTPLAAEYRTAASPQTDPALSVTRSWMGVPMLANDRLIGILALTSSKPDMYSVRQGQLATAIASQAALAIENARLFQQAEERTEELATLLQVSTNVASTIELEPLLHLILDQVQTVAPFYRGAFMVLDDDEVEVLAVGARDGVDDPEYVTQVGLRLPARGAMWARMQSGDPYIIRDVQDDSSAAVSYRDAVGADASTTFYGLRGWMGVPIMLKDRAIGMMALGSDQPDFYNEQHARLARAVADQAGVVIENARLYQQAEERTEELATLLDVSSSVASTIELQPLLDVILQQIRRVAPYDGATFFVLRGDRLRAESYVTRDDPGMDLTTIGIEIPISGMSIWERIWHGETIIIEDIYNETEEAASIRRAAGPALKTRWSRIRSWLGIPLMRGEHAIGLLALSGHTPGVFDARHARLARSVADRAALAIENARLFSEASDRTRELAALLDIAKDVASMLDRGPLVGAILEQLRGIVDYNGASILLQNGDFLEMVENDRDALQLDPGLRVPMRFPIADNAPLWDAMLEGTSLIVPDMQAGESAANLRRAVGQDLMQGSLRHVRALLAVPLVVHKAVIGTLIVANSQPGYFTDDHARVVRAVADQAAVALENARLYEETSRRARETQALLRADAELFRSLSVDDVFQALCDVAVDVLGVSKCMVTTIQDESGRYTTRASRGLSQTALRQMALVRERTPRGELGTMSAPIVTVDARSALPEMSGIFEMEGIVSTMDVPIRIDGQVRGDFALAFTRRHAPGPDEQRLFQALADRAAIAIQNAELYERSQQVASLEERQRLARELHDSVSQALYGIALGARTARTQLDRDPLKAVEPVEYVLQLAEAGLAEMRALIFELRPESLQTEGLVAAIDKHVASTRARYGLDVDAELGLEPDARIEVKEALYRVTQEALHNIVKHAQAKQVRIRLGTNDGAVALQVSDDGRGFDANATYPGHVGLHSMRERIEKVRGTIAIESAPGAGSRVSVRVPLNGTGR